MKDKISQIKNLELETIIEVQDNIGNVLVFLDVYKDYVDKRRLKELNRCYKYLDTLWESIEDTICSFTEEDK